jgi:hypothetical protein
MSGVPVGRRDSVAPPSRGAKGTGRQLASEDRKILQLKKKRLIPSAGIEAGDALGRASKPSLSPAARSGAAEEERKGKHAQPILEGRTHRKMKVFSEDVAMEKGLPIKSRIEPSDGQGLPEDLAAGGLAMPGTKSVKDLPSQASEALAVEDGHEEQHAASAGDGQQLDGGTGGPAPTAADVPCNGWPVENGFAVDKPSEGDMKEEPIPGPELGRPDSGIGDREPHKKEKKRKHKKEKKEKKESKKKSRRDEQGPSLHLLCMSFVPNFVAEGCVCARARARACLGGDKEPQVLRVHVKTNCQSWIALKSYHW